MANQPSDRTRRQRDQRRAAEQQHDRGDDRPRQGGQGGQTDTNRSVGQGYHERHPTSGLRTDED